MSCQDEVSGYRLGPRLTSPCFSPTSCVQEHQHQAVATYGCACGGFLGAACPGLVGLRAGPWALARPGGIYCP